MRFLAFAFLALTAIMIMGCDNKTGAKGVNQNKAEQNKIAEKKDQKVSIKLHTIDGKEITFTKDNDKLKLSDSAGKIVLLDFFATWCPPCKAEIPHLINIQKRYKDNLLIVGVLLEDGKPDSEIKSFASYNHINYTITNGANNFKLSNLLGGIQNIPFMILYDKDGNVITHYIGIIPEEMIDSDIKKAIGK